jgi:hypothetical protein
MLTLIDCTLTEPPSNTTCFRDVTVYAAFFLDSEILLECEKESQDLYYKWLKRNYSWDYVSDIIQPGDEIGVSIRVRRGSISVDRISYDNLNDVLSRLKTYHSFS